MVSRRMQAVESPIIAVIGEMIRGHPGTISLGQGVVHWPPPREVLEAVARFGREPRDHLYSAVTGQTALRDALEQKLWQENHIKVMPASRVVVTAGANMGFVNALLAIADPGDEVILNAPYYFNHHMALTMAGCVPVAVPTTADYQLNLEAIRGAVTDRTRAVVTISPNNPTGAVYPEEALYEVNQLCRDAGIYHISDEAYEHFIFDGARHFSPGSVAEAAEYTISLYSLSKSHGMASWRMGCMVIPEELLSAVKKIQDTILICPPAISQHAALAALSPGPQAVRTLVAALDQSRRMTRRALEPLGDLLDVAATQGAIYFFARLRTEISAMRLAEELIRRHKVAVIPGEAFGSDGPSLRIGYGSLPPPMLAEALTRLTRGLRDILG